MKNSTSPQSSTDSSEDLTPDEERRLLRVVERREARRLADDRKARGLRSEPGVLRCVAPAPVPYPANWCTTANTAIPEPVRCNGAHPWVRDDILVNPGELIRQWPGHLAGQGDGAWTEIADEGLEPTVEDFLVVVTPLQTAISAAEERIQSDGAAIETHRRNLQVIEDQIGRIEKIQSGQHEPELVHAESKLQELLALHSEEWRRKVLAGRTVWSAPALGDDDPALSPAEVLRRMTASGAISQAISSAAWALVNNEGVSLDNALEVARATDAAGARREIKTWPAGGAR